ncbi:hypothetical protein EV401DRAFT_2082399 [Pisolithus croceorrhizus]|nr:hypothetical protein EV401DRAFT_2082399 [Pisolithus croceorrhizus]
MNALNYEEAVHKLLKIQLKEERKSVLTLHFMASLGNGLVGSIAFGWSASNKHSAAIIPFIDMRRTGSATSRASLDTCSPTTRSPGPTSIMMQEMMESMGLKTLAERFKDEEIRAACKDMFPMDNPKNTQEMREYLKNAPRLIMEQRRALLEQESSSSDSDSSDDSDSDSDSDSASDSNDSNPDSDTVSDATESSLDSRRRARRSPTPRRDYSKDRSRGPVRSPDSSRGYTGRRGSPPHRRHESPPRRPREDGRERDRERERDRPRADVYDRRRRDDSRDRYYERERDRGYYSRDDGRRRDSYRDRSPSVRRGSPSPRRRRSDERDYDDRRR